MNPPVTLGFVWNYLIRNPNEIFIFVDQKACMTYYVPYHTVIYCIGDFAGNDQEITIEIQRAAYSMLN